MAFVYHALLEKGLELEEAQDKASESLRHFATEESLWQQYPRTFSGGEKLSLNLARTVAKAPRLLLLDEPTASLDQSSKVKVKVSIERLKTAGTTMIGIFHDIDFMESLITSRFDMHTQMMTRVDGWENK